jgi:hypothetical protein
MNAHRTPAAGEMAKAAARSDAEAQHAAAHPFLHLAKSWLPRREAGTPKPKPARKWLIYDNNGSYNGWFDGIPLQLRVGPWSPIAYLFLISWPVCLAAFRPPLSFAPPELTRDLLWSDALIFGWCIAVVTRGSIKQSPLAFCISYTGWSWLLLTAHSASAVAAALLPHWAASLLSFREAVRFPTAVGATVTAVLWNLVLFPVIVFSIGGQKERRNFLAFNCSFEMTSVHVLNVPMVWSSIYYGAGAMRTLGAGDLWVAMAVLYCYALLYVLILDRLGMHFYFMFSPRTHACGLAYTALIGCYVGCLKLWGGAL